MLTDTYYGARNFLKVKDLKKPAPNHYCFECIDSSSLKNKIYLHLVFVSETIVRFHFRHDKDFEITNPRDKDFVENDFRAEEEHLGSVCFKTQEITVCINQENLTIKIFDKEANLLCEDVAKSGFWSKNLGNYPAANNELRCYKKIHDAKNPPLIYGLGDKTGEINRWGKRFRNEPIDALSYDGETTDPLYKDIPFFIHLDRESKKAHGIFFDNHYKKFFDFGRERKPTPYYYFGAEGGELNYYFIAGPKASDVIARYLELTGKPPLMPKYIFGYLGSGMSYTENDNASQLIRNFVEESLAHGIKPSAFHLSSGYTLNQDKKRMPFIWNANIKDPQKLIKDTDIKYSANLKPALLTEHPWYKEVAKKGYFIKGINKKPLVSDFWGGEGSYIDFANEDAIRWWKEKITESFLNKNISGIWNDNNEFEIFDQHERIHELAVMPLLMTKASYEACLEHDENKRPWIISRSAYSGIQKYAQTWTGDNSSSFKSFKYDLAITNSMSVSGLIHCAYDIGGFSGESPSSELLTRWVAAGVFSPRFCVHSSGEVPTELWMYKDSHPEHFKAIQKFVKFRQKLIPYIYQANYKAHTEAKPIQRPTFLDFQDDEATYEESFDYIFGDSLLVAPIYEAGADFRKIYLPKLEEHIWIDFWNFKEYQAGQVLKHSTGLDTIPVFVKANSFVPMEEDSETLEMNLFLSKNAETKEVSYEFYEDDGESFNYNSDGYLITKFKCDMTKPESLSLSIEAEEGKFQSQYKKIVFRIVLDGKFTIYTTSRSELKEGIVIGA